ncbi:MAG: ABC transporter permease [Chloroflexi bacterium]|nr:ABC transporter permease [Chloroflexota bacterium]
MGHHSIVTRETPQGKEGAGTTVVRSFFRLLRSREVGVLLVLLLLVGLVALSPVRSQFLGAENLQDTTRQIGLVGIFSIGECIVIITAGIDLSVGSLIGLTSMIVAMLLVQHHWAVWAAFLATIGVGVLIGTIHAFFISAFNIPPFVITLGSLDVLRSLAELINQAVPISLQDAASATFVITLGSNNWHGVPIPFLLLIVLVIVAEIFMRKTPMGRHIYALGGNEEATRLSGVHAVRVRFMTYIISGSLAALAGILYAGYSEEGDSRMGGAFELTAIAAAVVGGCSLFGGEGSVIGTVIGAALLQVLVNIVAFVVKSQSSLWQGIIVGFVVVIAVMFNELREASDPAGCAHPFYPRSAG